MWARLGDQVNSLADSIARQQGEKIGAEAQAKAGPGQPVEPLISFGPVAEGVQKGAQRQYAVQKQVQLDDAFTAMERAQIANPDQQAFQDQYADFSKKWLAG